jgi:two-component system sensor histidine kinase ChiS
MLNNLISKISKKIPLRFIIIVPFVIEIFAVVGLTGWLSFRNGKEAVDDLATQLRSEMTTRIHQHLKTHTTMPHRANQLNVDAISLGLLKLEDRDALERHLWKQIQQFHTVSYVGIGTEQAAYVGAHLLNNKTLIEISDKSTGGNLEIWETENIVNQNKFKKTLLQNTLPNYKPQNLAWYLNAAKAGKPVWSKAYFSSRRTNLSVNHPIYSNEGSLLAVATADISVLDISRFLHSLKIGKTGQSFILERSSGLQIATSTSEKLIRDAKVHKVHADRNDSSQQAIIPESLNQSEPFKAINSNNALTSATARYLTQHFGELKTIKDRQNLNFIEIESGKQHFLQVMPFNDERGLDWLIVVVVPETDFMAHIDANMHYTILLCLVALILTIFVGVLSAQWIIQPLIHLNTTAEALAEGKWEKTAEFERQDEVGELANSFSRMTTQLQELFTTLESKNTELQRLNQLKDEFLANTSHELRTPLNGIIGIVEALIDDEQLSTKTRSELFMVVACGQRLANLVNDILDFSRQKYKNIDLQLKPVDMRKIAEIVLRFSQLMVGSKDLQLVNRLSNALPLVNADEARVQQILHNLVGNAIKFTEKGRIEVLAKIKNGIVPQQENFLSKYFKFNNEHWKKNSDSKCSIEGEELLLITVSDTGVGIPADKTTQIFKSYEQVGELSTEGGTGLGLAIAKQLVILHGGEIWVESTVGIGSRFTFSLPILSDQLSDQLSVNCEQKAEPSPVATTTSHGDSIQRSRKADALAKTEVRGLHAVVGEDTLPLQGGNIPPINRSEILANTPQPQNVTPPDNASGAFKILIVDDEPINLHVLVNHLSLYDYTVIQAASGAQALTILEEGIEPDLILLDVMMPYMTGYEVTQKIREKWEASKLPIILLTAKNQVSDLVMGLEMGANDYLVKPTSKNELLARIKTHLHVKQLHEELEEYSQTLELKVEERTCRLNEAKKAAENTLQLLKDTQKQLVESAKMAELGNLVAGVAHEINTPVGIGVTATSRVETLTDELIHLYKAGRMKRSDLDKYLKAAKQGSELTLKNLTRAAELIQSFKQVAVDQTGEQQRTFVLEEYLHEILTTLKPKFKRTQHQVSIECHGEIVLSSYPGIFSQIFTNFLMNSLIHGFKGKSKGKITITAQMSEKKELVMRYSDNGNGVPADVIDKIFDPFFTTNRQGGGSGLGLNIVYNLITHKLNGSIRCDSVEGEGITFTILVPISA